MEILKKDEKFFIKNMGHTKLTQYYKTKDNSLRIAIFENNEFIAFETKKGNGTFKSTVLDNEESFVLKNRKEILKQNGEIELIQYSGVISEKKNNGNN